MAIDRLQRLHNAAMSAVILEDDRWLSPLINNWSGFRGQQAVIPPADWEHEHRLAEIGGYFRDGRKWKRGDLRWPPRFLACMPTAMLCKELLTRVGRRAALAMGYAIE